MIKLFIPVLENNSKKLFIPVSDNWELSNWHICIENIFITSISFNRPEIILTGEYKNKFIDFKLEEDQIPFIEKNLSFVLGSKVTSIKSYIFISSILN